MLQRSQSKVCAIIVASVAISMIGQIPVAAQGGSNWQQFLQPAQQALDMENYASAESLYTAAMKQGHDQKNPAMEAAARAGYAETLLWEGKIKDASKEFEHAQKQVESALADQPELSDFYDAYSWLLQAKGDPAGALQYAQQSLALRQKIMPPNDNRISESMEHIGTLYERQSNFVEARKWYQQALTVRQQGTGDQTIPKANLLEKLAIVAAASGQQQQSQQLFQQSMEMLTQSGALLQRFSQKHAFNNAMYRFSIYSPFDSQSTDGGVTYGMIRTPENVIVQAALAPASDSNGKSSAKINLRVFNKSSQTLDFMPRPPLFITLTPQIALGTIMNLDQVAAKIQKKGEHKASMIRFFQGDATTPITSTVQNFGGGGYNPGGWGYWGNGGMGYNGYGNGYGGGFSQVTTYVPDYQARALAEQKAQNAVAQATEAAAALRQQALGPTSIPAGQSVEGAIEFAVPKFNTGIVRIPIGNAIFEFPMNR